MFGVVAGCDDDAAVGMFIDYRHFGCGSGGQACLDNVYAHTLQGADHQAVDHRAAEACIAAYGQTQALAGLLALEEGGER